MRLETPYVLPDGAVVHVSKEQQRYKTNEPTVQTSFQKFACQSNPKSAQQKFGEMKRAHNLRKKWCVQMRFEQSFLGKKKPCFGECELCSCIGFSFRLSLG